MTDARIEPFPISRREILVFLISALVAALVTRLWVVPLTVIDWDESIYLLLSRDILNGVLPYQGAFDHKPVGLYYTFALAQLVFGQGMVAIRLLGIIAVAATSFTIMWHLRRNSSADTLSAATAGILYAVLSPLNAGLATNTEILLNAYAAVAMALLGSRETLVAFRAGRMLLAGCVLGVLINTNYLAGPVAVGLCLSYAIGVWMRIGLAAGIGIVTKSALTILAGFALSTTLILLPSAVWGDLPGYFTEQIEYLTVYGESNTLREFFGGALPAMHHVAFLAALVAAVAMLTVSRAFRARIAAAGDGPAVQQMFTYIVFGTIAFAASGRLLPHYFILLLPPLCVGGGLLLAQFSRDPELRRFFAIWLIILALISLIPVRHWYARGLSGWIAWFAGEPGDLKSRLAREFGDRLSDGDKIYVFDYQPVLYSLFGSELPTRYPFPPHHLTTRFAKVPTDEMAKILAHDPTLVIVGVRYGEQQGGGGAELLRRALAERYRLVGEFREPENTWRKKVLVYERR